MGSFIARVDAWVAALGFAAAMLAVWAIARWRYPAKPEEDPGTGGKFTDASMAILGLLLAFTFSMSLGRHDHRRATVVAESNSIGDFYTCASLLKEPVHSRLQAAIHDYASYKLKMARDDNEAVLAEAIHRCQEMHGKMTAMVGDALAGGTPIAISLTNTLNDVTSNHAARLAAYRERLPSSIVALLFVASIVPAFLVGQQQAVAQKLHVSGTFSFIFLVALIIYVTLDLNQPTSGAIRVSQEPFERLIESMGK